MNTTPECIKRSCESVVNNINKEDPSSGRYIQQINAELADNHLVIKIEKNKAQKKKTNPCQSSVDSGFIEIKRPTGDGRPKIVNKGDCNEIIFKSPSQIKFSKDGSQSIAYKIDPCEKSMDFNGQCRRIVVYPGGSDNATSQVVHGDRIVCEGQDIFLLRVQKKGQLKKRDVELELRTPKPPSPPPTPPPLIQEITHVEKPQENKKAAKSEKAKQKKAKKKKKKK